METLASWVAGILGLALLIVIGQALVVELLVPRPAKSIVTHMTRWTTQGMVSFITRTFHSYDVQHRFLTTVAPLSIVATLFVSALGFLVAYALLIYAVTDATAMESVLESGSALLTLGIVQVVDPGQVALTFLAAFTGMVIIAALVGYLLMLFSAYNEREAGVTKSTMWAGEPAWGPELLCRRSLAGRTTMDPLGEGWLDWVCQVRVAQTTYPVLAYFRSAGPMRGWFTTLIARMDAASLELSLARHRRVGDLSSLLAEGAQTMETMRNVLEHFHRVAVDPALPPVPVRGAWTVNSRGKALFRAIRTDGRRSIHRRFGDEETTALSTLPREEFDRAIEMMAVVGIEMNDDHDAAWERFRALRGQYEANAYRIAEMIHAVPAPWTGPRRVPIETVWPTSSAALLQSEHE